MTRPVRVWTIVLALAALPAIASAQSVGTIAGTVLDASKGALPGAVVTARNEGTSAVREVVADSAGRYAIPLLPIGSYTLSAAMSGFQTQERSKIVLEVQASLTLDFTLDVAGVTTEVTVVSQASVVQLQRSDANLGQLINAQQVAELPLNGRNFVQLALLGPGTVTGRAGSFLAQGPSSEVSYRGSMSVLERPPVPR